MKTKQGVSLIVLVITIIVMVILAGAIVLTLNNSGIITNASEAVEKTNLATVKELAQTAWASAYADGERTAEKLKEVVDAELETHKINTTKYAVEVTENGVDVILKGEWVQTGQTVTNGEITIKVGEKINYIATGTDYTGDWKVLGASEYGELLIMSDDDVVSRYRLGYESTTTDSDKKLEESQKSWLNAVSELNKVCEPYGKGKGARGARSITVEDVNKITGYDVEASDGYSMYDYGNVVEYSYNGTIKPGYAWNNGKYTGTLSREHNNGFHFYNGKEFVHINDLLTGESGKTFATLKSNECSYSAVNLEHTEEASAMLYGEVYYEESFGGLMCTNAYLLANSCVIPYNDYVEYGILYVGVDGVYSHELWSSDGAASSLSWSVRAVVALAGDVKLTANTAGGWNIK